MTSEGTAGQVGLEHCSVASGEGRPEESAVEKHSSSNNSETNTDDVKQAEADGASSETVTVTEDAEKSAANVKTDDSEGAERHAADVSTEVNEDASTESRAGSVGVDVSEGIEKHAADIRAEELIPEQCENVSAREQEQKTAENVVDVERENDVKSQEAGSSSDDHQECATVNRTGSSDDIDQFVDAKSQVTTDVASAGDAESSTEVKEVAQDEQEEEVEEEEEYDDEEQEPEPDDDEIEDNPAYIPKSGRYYMHDSRNVDDEERVSEPSSRSRADGKWKHDRFDERSQRPKTKRELMNRYGYDIRNEGQNTGGNNTNGNSVAPANRNRGASRGGGAIGRGANRGRYTGRTAVSQQQQQHIQNDRRDNRRPVQDSGMRRPIGRGGRRVEHHSNVNAQRDQLGTRVFKNSPINSGQRAAGGAANRVENHRPYNRANDERMRDGQRYGGRGRSGTVGGGGANMHERGSHSGGKRYSTQRLTTSYVPEAKPPPPPPPPPPPQPAPAAGPIPIPPPDWRPPAYQGPPPPAPPPPQPPPIAVPAPVPNFRSSDIVYFDPQPQQLYRNPIPPRAKKRLEIVPPYQAKNPS